MRRSQVTTVSLLAALALTACTNAKDVLEYKNIADKPKRLLEKALTALKGIDRKGAHYKKDVEVKKKLKEIIDIIEKMKKDLGIG